MEGPIPHHHHFPPQHLTDDNLFNAQTHPSQDHHHPPLVSQLGLDPIDSFQFNPHLDAHHSLQQLQPRDTFEQRPSPRFHEIRPDNTTKFQQEDAFTRGSQFGVLTSHPQVPSQPQSHQEAQGRLQNEIDLRPVPIQDGGTTEGHFSNLKLIPNPPHLEEWRKRLFNVDGVIVLTEDE